MVVMVGQHCAGRGAVGARNEATRVILAKQSDARGVSSVAHAQGSACALGICRIAHSRTGAKGDVAKVDDIVVLEARDDPGKIKE